MRSIGIRVGSGVHYFPEHKELGLLQQTLLKNNIETEDILDHLKITKNSLDVFIAVYFKNKKYHTELKTYAKGMIIPSRLVENKSYTNPSEVVNYAKRLGFISNDYDMKLNTNFTKSERNERYNLLRNYWKMK